MNFLNIQLISACISCCIVLSACNNSAPAPIAEKDYMPAADSMLQFIKANKDKSSIYLTRNDTVVAKLNEQKVMPLASTVKILVAVEFAKQAASKRIDTATLVPLAELDRYYLANTDGNAHPAWLDAERNNGHITGEKIKLIDVARGMIMYSSNANTEYLQGLLGLDSISSNIELFGIRQHSRIYPIVSSLFMYQLNGRTEDQVLEDVGKLSDESYSAAISNIHQKIRKDTTLRSRFNPFALTISIQKMWSDRLMASTTADYAHLAAQLNTRKVLNSNAYNILSRVLEFPMERERFKKEFSHFGIKGGSTAFVLTTVLYFTTVNGDRMEFAIFFNDLDVFSAMNLQSWLEPFEQAVIYEAEFRAKMVF